MAAPYGVLVVLGRHTLSDWCGYPDDFEALEATDIGVAGTPETVRRYIADSVAQTGITYFACDMAFGSLPYDIAARSVDLFVKDLCRRSDDVAKCHVDNSGEVGEIGIQFQVPEQQQR